MRPVEERADQQRAASRGHLQARRLAHVEQVALRIHLIQNARSAVRRQQEAVSALPMPVEGRHAAAGHEIHDRGVLKAVEQVAPSAVLETKQPVAMSLGAAEDVTGEDVKLLAAVTIDIGGTAADAHAARIGQRTKGRVEQAEVDDARPIPLQQAVGVAKPADEDLIGTVPVRIENANAVSAHGRVVIDELGDILKKRAGRGHGSW